MDSQPLYLILFRISLAVLLAMIFVVAQFSTPAGKAQLQEFDSKKIPCCQLPTIVVTQDPEIGTSGLLCGRLVYFTDDYSGLSMIGLVPCGRQKPYVFKRHPRDLVPYFQFRNAKIKQTSRSWESVKKDIEMNRTNKTPPSVDDYTWVVYSPVYGYLDEYIVSFKNYVGIEDCDECGKWNLPPTWTHAPKFSYTPTPTGTSTPTSTPVTPSPTPTSTIVTPTKSIAEVLFGDTPSAFPTAGPPGGLAITPKPVIQPTDAPPPSFGSVSWGLYLGLSLVGLSLLLLVYEAVRRSRQ